MAKLYLKYGETLLKEVPITQPVISVGRLPDNTVQLDNPAVSSYHARIYWERDHYVIEDNNSLNGTYVNSQRVTKSNLKDGDSVLIGKHTLVFESTGVEYIPGREGSPTAQPGPGLPKVDETLFLDTRTMKDMIATGKSDQSAAGARGCEVPLQKSGLSPLPAATPIATLKVLEGKTDQRQYVLASSMSAIGSSGMASIKLKGWFAPKMAAIISKTGKGYFVAASEKKIKVKVNGEQVAGQKSLSTGDIIEVAGVKMIFAMK